MISIKRTTVADNDFISLVELLDHDLKIRDGDEHHIYAQYNKIEHVNYVVVAYKKDIPVGCGALKHFKEQIAEVKRMFVSPECRGEGIATKVLNELEIWARELNYTALVLETGVSYPEAITLYQKHGYTPIPRYGQYEQLLSSRCFKKSLN